MSNFFQQAQSDVKGLEEKILGPDYQYFKFIKAPEEMGMSADGSLGALANDIGGLIGYVEILVAGGGGASKVSGPLGNKFFLKTGATCSDLASGNKVTRSVYINNVPDGTIPFITSSLNGQRMTAFEGLVPGTMGNLARINPMEMFQAFMTGSNPDCQEINMQTIDVNNISEMGSGYVTVNDINTMPANWFPNGTKPAILPKKTPVAVAVAAPAAGPTASAGQEAFSTLDYSRMPNDTLIKVYYSALGLLGLYIFLKMFQKKIK